MLAGLLAALAGMVDAIGYLHLSGLFVSFMGGNSTGVLLAQVELDAGKIRLRRMQPRQRDCAPRFGPPLRE